MNFNLRVLSVLLIVSNKLFCPILPFAAYIIIDIHAMPDRSITQIQKSICLKCFSVWNS